MVSFSLSLSTKDQGRRRDGPAQGGWATNPSAFCSIQPEVDWMIYPQHGEDCQLYHAHQFKC